MSEAAPPDFRCSMVCYAPSGFPMLVDVETGSSLPLVDHMLIAVRGYWLPMETELMEYDDAWP